MKNNQELTWDEFIDMDFAYAEPKAADRAQSEALWKMQCDMNPGDWKFVLEGDQDQPDPKRSVLSSIIDSEHRTILLSFEARY